MTTYRDDYDRYLSILWRIYSTFRGWNKHSIAQRIFIFLKHVENLGATPEEALEFKQFLDGELSRTDPEANFWRETISELCTFIENGMLSPGRLNMPKPGSMQAKRWLKYAPTPISTVNKYHGRTKISTAQEQAIEAYKRNGWHVIEAMLMGGSQTARFQFRLEQVVFELDDHYHYRTFIHQLTILIDAKGNVTKKEQPKSEVIEHNDPLESEPPAEMPKRARRKPRSTNINKPVLEVQTEEQPKRKRRTSKKTA